MPKSRRIPARIGHAGRTVVLAAFLMASASAPASVASEQTASESAVAAQASPIYKRDILVDPATGLALFGYDPVAYFVDRKPRLGKVRYEYMWSGIVWRFVNEGNLAAFAAQPLVYVPRYGGYDPLALANGALAQGDPMTWLIYKQQLFLFFSPSKRFLWLAAAEHNLSVGDRRWVDRHK